MRGRQREGRAEANDGVGLYWRLWEADDPWGSIMMVHGLGEHSGRYVHLAARLNGVGLSVFSFDLRGHGRSEGPKGDVTSFGLFLDDLELMETVRADELGSGGANFILGHSLGGLIVLRRLQEARGPYEGAVLSAPWLRAAQPGWLRALGRLLGRVAPTLPLFNGLGPQRLTRDPQMARAWREDPLIHTRLTGRLFREAEKAQRIALELETGMGGLPILFLIPEKDPVVDSATTIAFARAFTEEEVHVEILEGRMHEAFNDLGREEVMEIVEAWVERDRP